MWPLSTVRTIIADSSVKNAITPTSSDSISAAVPASVNFPDRPTGLQNYHVCYISERVRQASSRVFVTSERSSISTEGVPSNSTRTDSTLRR